MLEDLFKIVKDRFNDDKTEKIENRYIPEKNNIPKDLLFKCPRCRIIVHIDDFNRNKKVCSHCNYHSRLSWGERLEWTADNNSFFEFDKNMTSGNPIDYPGYENKIEKLQKSCKIKDAVVTGTCTIHGYRAVIIIMDSNFMMASMGSVVGEKITRAFEYGADKKLPVVLFAASGGARMQEGIISLMQMAKTSAAITRLNSAGQLYISILTDPTTGGVTASFASLGDIIIAEPKVLIGFAGRRVIQDTIKQHLPDDFQSAEFLLENGFVDLICDRNKMRSMLSNILKIHNYEAVKGEVCGNQ